MSEHVDLSSKPIPESETASTITNHIIDNELSLNKTILVPTKPNITTSLYNNNNKKKKTASLKYKMKQKNEIEHSFETMDLDHIPISPIISSLSPPVNSHDSFLTHEKHTILQIDNNNNNNNILLQQNSFQQQQPISISQNISTSSTSYQPIKINNTHTKTTFQPPKQPKQGLRPVPIRNYEQFPGNNTFLFKGRILTSRAFWAFAIAIILLCGPSILFAIFTCPWLWYNISPAIPIIFGYLFILSFASMIKTSWTDPGILPRNLYAPSTISTKDRFGHAYELQHEPPPPLHDITIKGEVTQLKYCDTCGIYRPPRASHCRQCNNCVEYEDHHCIWLNNCIGRRNYRSFFTFIITATLLCLYVLSFTLVQLVSMYLNSSAHSFNIILSETPISLLLAILCFLLAIPVGSLTGYHIFLTMRGVTTHEQLRYSIAMKPFEKHMFDFGNPLINFNYALCRPRAKSYLARRKFMQERYNIETENDQTTESQNINQLSSSITHSNTNSPIINH